MTPLKFRSLGKESFSTLDLEAQELCIIIPLDVLYRLHFGESRKKAKVLGYKHIKNGDSVLGGTDSDFCEHVLSGGCPL